MYRRYRHSFDRSSISHGRRTKILADKALRKIKKNSDLRKRNPRRFSRPMSRSKEIYKKHKDRLQKQKDKEAEAKARAERKRRKGYWYWYYPKVPKKNVLYKEYLKNRMMKAAKKWEGVTPEHGILIGKNGSLTRKALEDFFKKTRPIGAKLRPIKRRCRR